MAKANDDPPPDKSELLNLANFTSPQAVQAQLDSLAAQGYVTPVCFPMNGGVYIYVGGYVPWSS